MYKFAFTSDKAAFDRFIEKNGGWYIQCSRWERVKTTWKCRYLLGLEGEKTVLAAFIMERSLPAAGKIWYCSAGPVCDYENTELLAGFTEYIKAQIRKNGVTAFIADPSVSLRINGEPQPCGEALHSRLIEMGYRLNTSLENYTYKQPVQFFIELTSGGKPLSSAEVLKKCDKGVRYSVRLGTQRGLVAKSFTYSDIRDNPAVMDDFMAVMRDTSERDSFVERNAQYCTGLLKEFDGHSDLKLIYYDRDLDEQLEAQRLEQKEKAESELEGAHEKKARMLKEQIDSINKQSEHFKRRSELIEAYTDKRRICVAGGLSIYYAGMGSCLFGGTANILRNETRSSHYLNYLRLCESIDRGCKIHDLGYVIVKSPQPNSGGALGSLEPTDNFKGIYDFKRSFGAGYHEFIGEYVLVNKSLRYFAYAKLMPKAKKAKVSLIKLLRRA